MRLPGHSAKEPKPSDAKAPVESGVPSKSMPKNPVPMAGAVIEPKPQSWRVDAKQTTQSITRDNQGRWILAAEANDGHRWEVDATDAIQVAVARETETLRHELEIALRAVDREAEQVAAKVARIKELEEENTLVRDWLTQYYERYGDLSSESGSGG